MASYSLIQEATYVTNQNSVLVKDSSYLGYYAPPRAYTINIRRNDTT
jgi:hypothetical protein